MHARPLPASWYHDPAVYERERTGLFGREWLLEGHAGQLPGPGDRLASELCGWPVLVVRDDEGGLRAFYNVCPHRAGPIAWEGAASSPSLVCRYHGWSYTLSGALLRARDFGADPPAGDFALTPVRVEEWRGLVFVNLDATAPSLVGSLGTFTDECGEFDLEAFGFSHETAHDVAANWKTYADNYMEGYHIPLVHPGLNREVDVRRYRVDLGERYCVHSAPSRDGATTLGKWLWRFPNLALNLYPDGMSIERFLPLGPQRTRIVYTYCFRDLGPAARAANDEMVRLSFEILDEDRAIVEAVQRNLASGAYGGGVLSPRHEHGVAYPQSLVREAVGA